MHSRRSGSCPNAPGSVSELRFCIYLWKYHTLTIYLQSEETNLDDKACPMSIFLGVICSPARRVGPIDTMPGKCLQDFIIGVCEIVWIVPVVVFRSAPSTECCAPPNGLMSCLGAKGWGQRLVKFSVVVVLHACTGVAFCTFAKTCGDSQPAAKGGLPPLT